MEHGVDLDEFWQVCSSSKFASNDMGRFLIWCHNFKMAAITSSHTQHLLGDSASAFASS